jgi:hypothetical protein
MNNATLHSNNIHVVLLKTLIMYECGNRIQMCVEVVYRSTERHRVPRSMRKRVGDTNHSNANKSDFYVVVVVGRF